ncbi:protein of unknown function [Geoalkalibacter ferrihydriticus]|uniref:DUF4917 domain-containing protein n=2 Tax=Geoalkalibacter ferrihydriticus TaxID=392333 RepID=A0A0C2ECD5_9BACT|nr:DUF4917 family protein [Geoalkalibacter ferrihydriticus]KIH76248.1 hypothetical protein GFER_11550 [Geoalkalibacter ferrihydriticus DSM 17813]SDL24600.1 protein of unknown function [Geoalkalibacter ferrihydriticus]
MTFEEMRETIGEERISVLLGNGFSRSWCDEPFHYETLYYAARFGDREREIRQLFTVLETQDFEKVTSRLRASRDILRLYAANEALVTQLEADAQLIKDGLLRAIAETHPSRPNEISDTEYRHVRSFLARFKNIYTVNYDLLMYWARNQNDLPPDDWDTDDGFRGDRLWVGPDTDQEIFFLHGALHLYETRYGVRKHSFTKRGQAIIDTVQENLRQNVFPLFVSEPTSEAKLNRINKNPYLSYCLRQLAKESGYMFIFGHGFSDVDRHIFSAVDHSSVNHVFVAIFGDPNAEDNRRIRGNATAYLQTEFRRVSFVEATSVPIWRDV